MILKASNVSTKNFFLSASKKVSIPTERKLILLKIAESIATVFHKNDTVNLNFICTHNSRRSQLAQVWSFYAAHYFNLNIDAFSGGTEVTAFHRNIVKTLQKAGFHFQLEDFSHQNPKYLISFEGAKKTILGFSKLYSEPINKEPFIAVTTCDDADKNCPFITTAIDRFHLPFVDPKASDGSEKQDETYLKTNHQIASEVYFIFSQIKKNIS
jgi:arsenate reductase